MHLHFLEVLFLTLVALTLVTPSLSASVATAKPKYLCESDDDCEANFPGTVCIAVDTGGDITRKCTPNNKERPACRGAQPGLCPSYQSPEVGYLNAQCVFVPRDMAATANRTLRQLAASSDGSKGDDIVVPEDATEAPGGYITVKIGKEPVTGEFMCVDISDCANKAADETTCEPLACGAPGAKEQCNNHGTCSYASTQLMSKRSCRCYAGFGGDKCQQEVSNACDVDCGIGGDCVNGACQCKKGFDGGKKAKGTPNQRCTKCTSDQACQNDNKCNVETGVCECSRGFFGPTCGATEDACTTMKCGVKGECQLAANKTAVCVCRGPCAGECPRCTSKDCSTCETSHAMTHGAQRRWIAVAVAAMAIVSIAMY